MGHFNHSITSRRRLEAEYKRLREAEAKTESKSTLVETKRNEGGVDSKVLSLNDKDGDGAKLKAIKSSRCPSPKNDMATRFSSTYYMLEELDQVATAMNTVLVSSPKATTQRLVLGPEILTGIKEALVIMKPIHDASQALSSENQARIASAGPRFYRLTTEVEQVIPCITNEVVLAGAMEMYYDLLETRLPRVCTPLHILASALDPNEKELRFTTQLHAKAAWDTITKECSHVSLAGSSLSSSEDAGSDDEYVPDVKVDDSKTQAAESVAGEIRRYKAVKPRQTVSLLRWWSQNAVSFPRVAVVARKYLSAMATSLPCERLFSTGGNIGTVKRTRLTDYHVSAQMFLKVNYNWVFKK